MRGEHLGTALRFPGSRGSSPHARGARPGDPRRDAPGGIIPACAGSTRARRRAPTSRRDHPRMRGEHWMHRTPRNRVEGSSPHARGALHVVDARLNARGIIPACAGSTRCRWSGSIVQGSSPHARGALAEIVGLGTTAGIIPACAGSTTCHIRAFCTSWDHPRMRGEHYVRMNNSIRVPGSSPHARGAPRPARPRGLVGGIIPACAGSTRAIDGILWWRRDHPRMRGEHRCTSSCGTRRGDHPRMRGEHLRPNPTGATDPGSSPHARGAPLLLEVCDEVGGIIPACAGSTSAPP